MTAEGTEQTDRAPQATTRPDGPPPAPAAHPPPVEAPPDAASVEQRPDAVAGSAVLDEAHIGDIEGALGRIRLAESERAAAGGGLRRRLLTFLAILGPGMIVMVGDNDAGGVATYAQAGQNYDYSLLWTLLLLIPVLIVNQEMVVRLGAVTGVGHARLINERFGRFWGWFSVGDLFLLNFLTIVTEFIGVALALNFLGISKYISVPIAATALIGITVTGSFRRWERAMLLFIAANAMVVPLLLLSHPDYRQAAVHLVVPSITGGAGSDAVLLIIAIVGTTVAPWQLFFQQSNVVDKRITPRFIRYERLDTILGSFVTVTGAVILLVVGAYAVHGTALAGRFTDALGVADALSAHSRVLGVLFALILLDASIIGAAAVTLSTSYAFGDMFGLRHSLHRKFGEAKPFYLSYTGLVVVAAAIVLIPRAPLGLITTAVQALAGLLLPSASVFLLLLCNDPQVLGPRVNRRWLNIVAGLIIGVLLLLSSILLASTLFPTVNTVALTIGLSAALVIGSTATFLVLYTMHRSSATPKTVTVTPVDRSECDTWRMPPLRALKPYVWTPSLRLGMLLLRAYLILSALLLLVKAIQLGRG
jgi:Mn2+/Fe2+ NRAMP family transporter